jgi:glycosyltransferase involved in cell wall biosynthesis
VQRPLVTVVVITHNSAQHLGQCLEALRRQTFTDLEILVVDDGSDDATDALVKGIDDRRVVYTRNASQEGRPRSRNRATALATGELIFFTDADCMPIRTWVEEGVQVFREHDCAGVEGRTRPTEALTLAQRSVVNEEGGQWQTCNIAYRRSVLLRVGGFDERYVFAYEDRDLALRVLREGRIEFCSDMLVFHTTIPWTWRGAINNALRSRDRVRLIVEHGDRAGVWGVVVEPVGLVTLVCPVLLLLYHPTRSVADLRAAGLMWVRAVVQRLVIWHAAWQARRLLL